MSARKNEIVEIFFPMWVINFVTNRSKADPARFWLNSEIYSGLGPGVLGGGGGGEWGIGPKSSASLDA